MGTATRQKESHEQEGHVIESWVLPGGRQVTEPGTSQTGALITSSTRYRCLQRRRRNLVWGGADLRAKNLGVTPKNRQKDAKNSACIIRPPMMQKLCETWLTTDF